MQETISKLEKTDSSYSFSNEFEAYKDEIPFNARLDRVTESNLEKAITEVADNLAPKIFNNNKKKYYKKKALKTVLINLIAAFLNGGSFVYIAMGTTHYSHNRKYNLQHISYRNITTIIRGMKDLDKIIIKPGYYFYQDYGEFKKGDGRRTCIQAKYELVNEIMSLAFDKMEETGEILAYDDANKTISGQGLFAEVDYSQPIVLKDEKKKRIDFKSTQKVSRSEKFLRKYYNELMRKTKIIVPIEVGKIFEIEAEEKKKYKKFRDKNLLKIIRRVRAEFTLYALMKYLKDNKGKEIENIRKYKNRIISKYLPIVIHNCYNYIYNIELNGQLIRVFNNRNFGEGGRFYTGEYQNIKREWRTNGLLINGNQTVEIDYKALHLIMLYHNDGIDYQDDAYTPGNIDKELRPAIKKMSLICINAKKGKVKNAFADVLRTNKELDDLLKSKNITTDNLMEQFCNAHQRINKYFFNNTGIKLQNKDAKIAESVMKHFTYKGIPVLCMHDSFIVEKQYQDELYRVMKEKYKEVMGFDIKVEVK